MPNHCINEIIISGEKSSIEQFWNKIKRFDENGENEKGKISIFRSFIPIPVEIENTKAFNDSPNWYDWAIENWGSKWGDYNSDLDLSGCSIFGMFNSAWSSCNVGIKKISSLFPDLCFEVDYHELGMMFIGRQVCKNGEDIEEWSREITKEDLIELGYEDDEEEVD